MIVRLAGPGRAAADEGMNYESSEGGVGNLMEEGRPVAYTALENGTPVISRSGHTIGTLDRVLGDDKGFILHGIVVKTGKGPRLVARDAIERMTTTQILCTLTDEQARDLPQAPSIPASGIKSWIPRKAKTGGPPKG
ncbi:hypothetical protein BWQ92_23005 [Arthrobacter sp. QXT-31]|nr:hypothetical protein BWQ92_23005 [Arthrobacter sp. QXT-31]